MLARLAATLMRSDGGPEVAVIEAGGWDTHANQGGAKGALAQRLAGLAPAALPDNRDLRPTLDLRSLFKALLDEHMHVDTKTLATRIFPDSSGARPLQGLKRA